MLIGRPIFKKSYVKEQFYMLLILHERKRMIVPL